MAPFEWFLVIAINGAIILFGLWKARETHRSVDWFLAAKGLPWWMVGLSMFATAVDSGDYVAVAGAAYKDGLSYISAWWLGLTIGWLIVAYVVLLPMYRTGMFTNAEYLEYRFGPVARVISVFIQIQSRTNVLANVAFSLFLTFNILTGWQDHTWWLVGGIALGAAIYTATGGLKSVVVTDTLQAVVMLIASIVLWWTVWSALGGWSGLEQRLDAHVQQGRLDQDVAAAMTHVGAGGSPGVPAGLVVAGWIIVLTAYCVVNQSQTMRMLAARSEWDVKMAAVLAAAVTVVVMWFNVTLGIMGRAVIPDLATGDEIFPQLVQQFLIPLQTGLTGIVVAGLLAGGISTYDSVGSALAAVFTRDLYARFFVRHADDRHYLRVSRIVTFVVIGISFGYIPFLKNGMVAFYLKISGVAVVPLLTVYLMGILTPVHRSSGTVGLVVGIVCGLTRFSDALVEALFQQQLPTWWTNTWWGYLWSILLTALAMVVCSLIRGFASNAELQGLTYSRQHQPTGASHELPTLEATAGTWIDTSRADVPVGKKHPFGPRTEALNWYLNPLFWTGLLVALVSYLNLVAFW